MASGSEHTGYIRGLSQVISTPGPVDTSACRDALINNTNQLLSQCTQTRIAFSMEAGTYFEHDTGNVDLYLPFASLPAFIFPYNFATTVIVPHIKVSVSAAGTADFLMRVTFYGDESTPTPDDDLPGVALFSTTSTTAVDVNPGKIWISYAAIMARQSRVDPGGTMFAWMPIAPSLDGEGRPSARNVLMAQLQIFAKSSVDTSFPRVHGLYAREYIGWG